MDYKEIGLRIRNFRLSKGLSQEKLAELVDISVTHMSHIETGNTKLSLSVFVALTEALDIRADELLHNPVPTNDSALQELSAIIRSCTPQQAQCIIDIAKTAKASFDRNFK